VEHVGTFTADAGAVPVPWLSAIGGILLGLGGLAAVLTALATRRNYITGGYKDRSDAAILDAANERARAERAEYMRDQWREAFYDIRDEAVAAGVSLTTRPPTEHPSEAP
jgi:hypothetical protein